MAYGAHHREKSATQKAILALLPSLAVDLIVPLLVYDALQFEGLPVTTSLAAAGAVPLARISHSALRRRRLNAVAGFVLCALATGVALTWLTGNPRLAIARDAVVGLAVGGVFLSSLVMRRPLMFHLLRSLRGPHLQEQWDRLPALRRDLRSMTAVIGTLCVLDACVRVAIAYTVPVSTAGALVHLQPIALVVLLMLVGKSWGERIRRYTQLAGSGERFSTNPAPERVGTGQRSTIERVNAMIVTKLR